MVLLVKYELNKPGKNYNSLYKAIESLGLTKRDPMLHTAWFVSSTFTPLQAYNVLTQHIDANDRLFITRLRSNEYFGWLDGAVGQWIAARL